MQVSFIIPTYNRRELLRHTLPTIFKQDFPNHEYEVVVVVDYNRWQGFGKTDEVVNLEPFREKWQSFGWETREINGHDHGEIFQALSGVPFRRGKPSALIAHTTKGKGVSFMEGRFEWHYLSPNEQQLKNALLELGE